MYVFLQKSVLIYEVEYCVIVSKLSFLPHMTHILNQHDPRSALVHNSFALTVC